MTEPDTGRLTEHERDLISEARRISPEYRASPHETDRLAGYVLAGLADLAERRGDVMERWDDDCDLIQVIFTPDNAGWLRTSLASRGIELYAIPSGENDLPTYGIRRVT